VFPSTDETESSLIDYTKSNRLATRYVIIFCACGCILLILVQCFVCWSIDKLIKNTRKDTIVGRHSNIENIQKNIIDEENNIQEGIISDPEPTYTKSADISGHKINTSISATDIQIEISPENITPGTH